MTKIKVTNKTVYPTREVAAIVRKTLGYLDITRGIEVTVYHRKRTWRDPSGRYVGGYYRTYWYPSKGESGPQIRAGIAQADVEAAPWYPYQRKREQGPEIPFADWREQLVALIAHEGFHHVQYRKRTPRREVDCDLAAHRAVGYWRQDRRAA